MLLTKLAPLALAVSLLSPQSGSDPKAVQIAEQLMEGMGGQAAWDAARFLGYTRVRRGQRVAIIWDKQTGRFRLEANNRDGEPFVALMSLTSKSGSVYLNGKELDGDALSEYQQTALRAWAGTTYWFLMPYKWRDPGVVLTYVGEERIDGQLCDKLHLEFDDVGVTPGDEYWAYVNRETHLMDRFQYKLQGGAEGDYRWKDWRRHGGILLARERVSEDETFHFEDLSVATDLPDTVFTDPSPAKLP